MNPNIAEPKKFVFDLGRAFPTLTSFLTTQDKMSLAATCHLLYDLVYQSHTWHTFYINDFDIKNWEQYRNWIAKYIDIIKPLHISVTILENQHENDKELVKIFIKQRDYVQKVQLRCETAFLNLAIAHSCPSMISLTFHSNSVSDQLVSAMVKNCPEVRALQINADSLDFQCTKMQCFQNPIESLVLKPYQLDYEEILNFLSNQKLNQISQLQLDMQECPQQILPKILSNLPYIKKLRLFHMQKFEDHASISTAFNKEITQLSMGKCYHLEVENIIHKIASQNLLKLDLTQAIKLRDNNLIFLASKAINLKFINISWCNQLTNESVKQLVQNCLWLQGIIVNGLKNLNDNAFPEYQKLKCEFNEKQYDSIRFQFKKKYKSSKKSIDDLYDQLEPKTKNLFGVSTKKLSTLRNLRHLQCNSCNNVSDTLLKLIYFSNRTAKVINYYGEVLSLYHTSQLSEDQYY